MVCILYFLLPYGWRWILLLAASCYFYMAFIPVYILILLVMIMIDYCAGIWIEQSQGSRRKFFLILSIISTCAVLFIFKYFNFFASNIDMLAKALDWNYSVGTLKLILPIGLSFHTFQSLAYVIEVYRGNQKAEKHFGIYALYVMFFPQLVAGPIERPQNLLPQLRLQHDFSYDNAVKGARLFLWGFFKKVVVADRIAEMVNIVYGNPSRFGGGILLIATVLFAFQIYCDFSGYSDIAIGSARFMGIRLMRNFNMPYFSTSMMEFWRRWHISLSTWFRDYVYIPLGGNRFGLPRQVFSVMITFLLSGFWHGANWTFVIWGFLHGVFLSLQLVWNRFLARWPKLTLVKFFVSWPMIVRIMLTFALVDLGWVFFRARTIQEAFFIIHKMLFVNASNYFYSGALYKRHIFFPTVFIIILLLVELLQVRYRDKGGILFVMPAMVRWMGYFVFAMIVAWFGMFHNTMQFIYFQF